MLVIERRIRPMGLLVMTVAFGLGGCMHRDHESMGPRSYGSLKDHIEVSAPAKKASAAPRAHASNDAPRVLPPLKKQAAAQPAAVAAPAVKAPEPAPAPRTSAPAPSAPAAPPAAAPPPATLDAATVERLLIDGQRLFESGKVLEARRKFIAAMNGPVPEVLLALGRTYDTYYLSRLPAADAAPDMQRALVLYERAVDRGAIEANADLERTRGILKVPR